MSRRRPRLWLPTSFVVAYLALGWLIYQQLTGAPNTEALARIQPEKIPALNELPPELQFTMAAIGDFDSVLERPLFSPSRRPAPVEEGAAPAGGEEFDYVLKGVLIDIEARIALLSHKGGAGTVRLAEGTKIDGWLLKEVEGDFIVVERNGEERIVELIFQSPPPRNAPGK
jgi:hypothetical protein